MQFPYKTQVLIGLASVLGIALIAAAVLLLPRAPSYGPADLIPADRALLYVDNIDPSLRERLGAVVPFLNTLPEAPGETAALVRHDDGTTDWVVFGAQIRAGNPATMSLIGTGAALGADPSFRALARGRAGTGAWLYVRAAQNDVSLPPALRQPHGPAAFSLLPDETQIAWTTSGIARPLSVGFKDLGRPAAVRVQAGDLRAFMGRALAAVNDRSLLAYEAALRSWFAGTFGTDLSPVYDLAPLLEGQATLTLVRGGSGTLALLEGSARGAAERLDALHAGFSAAFGGARRVERVFDESFSVDNIRAGSGMEEKTAEADGWSIRSTGHGQKGMHTALKGDRFILSNDSALLHKALETFPAPAGDETGTAVARGELSREDAVAMLRTVLPGEDLPLPSGLFSASLLRWELVRNGNLAILRLF